MSGDSCQAGEGLGCIFRMSVASVAFTVISLLPSSTAICLNCSGVGLLRQSWIWPNASSSVSRLNLGVIPALAGHMLTVQTIKPRLNRP